MSKGGGVVQPPSTDAKEALDAELTSFHFGIADHDGRLRANIDWDVNLGWSMMDEKVQHRIELTKLQDSIDSCRKAVHSRLAEFEEKLWNAQDAVQDLASSGAGALWTPTSFALSQ